MLLNPHLRSHLLAFWLAVVAVVLGLMLMVAPITAEQSPSLAVMPPAGVFLWGLAFAVGGGAVLFGLVGLRRRWESAGSILLGSAYLSSAIGGVIAGTATPISLLFLSAITIGFFHRGYFLAKDASEV